MSGGIFLLDSDKRLVEMTETTYDSEDLLQGLLADYPSLMAGDQVDPTAPRKWILIAREMGVPGEESGSDRWSVDHLFLDQDAVPTLVEVKRSSDTRIRREVIGQMLDYAANAQSYWSLDRIQAIFEAKCEKAGEDSEEALAECLNLEGPVEDYWQKVKTNLQAGRMRLVFVADEIPQELRRIVEFLNEQMDPAEVLALEVKQYVGGDGLKTLVPRVIGQSATAQQKKSGSAGPRRKWDESSFFEELQKSGEGESIEVAKALLAWAEAKEVPVWWGEGKRWGSFSPRVIVDGTRYQLFVVWTNGALNIYSENLQSKPAFHGNKKIHELMQRLSAISGVDFKGRDTNREPGFKLEVLKKPEALKTFLKAFDWLVGEIRST